MSIKDKFEKRKEYDELNSGFNYPTGSFLYTNYYLDSWYTTPLYGKVDTLGIPIMPNLSSIKYCSYGYDKDNVQALEPLNNFFFPLREQYTQYYSIGSFNKSSKFYKKDIPPVRGFINGEVEYQSKVKDLYSNFVQHLIDSNKLNSTKNYDLFIDELLNYIYNNNLYITRAGFVESLDYSILHTGLSVEIFKESSSNDEERIKFLEDINGEAFLELCIRNNIKIDREIPWRLYVDIRTKSTEEKNSKFKQLSFESEIKNYIPEFKNDLQLFFDTYYTRVVPYDTKSYIYFAEFVNIINSFYSSFLVSHPTYLEYKVNDCGKANVVKKARGASKPKYIFEHFLELYIKSRNAELSKTVEKEKLLFHSEIALEMYRMNISKNTLQTSILQSIKYYTQNIGTLAYRAPSIYELDINKKMP